MPWATALFVAVAGSSCSSTPASVEAGVALDAASDLGPSSDAGPSAPAICGRIVDEDDRPRPRVYAQLCHPKICFSEQTEADGRVCFHPDRAGEYHFRSLADDELTFGEIIFPFPVSDEAIAPGATTSLGEHLVAVSVRGAQPVTTAQGGSFTLDGDVHLEIPPGALALPAFEPAGRVAAAAVPLSRVDPRTLAGLARPPEAAVLLLPPGAALDKARGLDGRLSLPTTLADGAEVDLLMPNVDTAALEVVGHAVAQGGRVRSREGDGLPRLGWIFVARP